MPGQSQDWAIEAAGGETVMLELATDAEPDAEGATQATSAIVTILDAATGDIVNVPTRLTFVAGAPRTVSFANGNVARTLVVQVDPDGALRMKKVGGNETLGSLPCPLRLGPATPILTITDTGVSPNQIDLSNGQQVFVINESSRVHQLASNPHPIHTDCPPMNNPGALAPGESGLTGAFTSAGTCGWHDHLNPISDSLRGEVQVMGTSSGGGSEGGGGGGEPGDMDDYLLPHAHAGH